MSQIYFLRPNKFITFLVILLATASNLYEPVTSLVTLSPLEHFIFNKRLTSIKKSMKTTFLDTYTPKIPKDTPDLTIIFPGAGGPDNFTSELQKNISSKNNRGQTTTIVVDWQEHRGSIISAAFDSEAVGEAVAKSLPPTINSIHAIGISVGAFAANSLARHCRSSYKRLTLLDPFCTRGIWGVGYGANNFGKDVNYAVQYLNTDDNVPSTNEPLPLCHVVDVTHADERKAFVPPQGESMHCWPVVYFARYGFFREEEQRGDRNFQHGQDGVPERGTVVTKK